jgi:hypothetical protein
MADHEVRELRFKLKQANAVMGRQGDTIHRLRGELAETRELNSKAERGDIRRLERENENLLAQVTQTAAENAKLRDELHPKKDEEVPA